MSTLEFIQRLAAFVPRPGLNLIRFHGILAAKAKLRPEIISYARKNEPAIEDPQDETPHCSASIRISRARLLKRVFDIDIEYSPH